MGAPEPRVYVTGNLKYDLLPRPMDCAAKASIRRNYHVPDGVTVITAGSTHPGEEEMVLAAYRELVQEGRELFLILAPRHPERADAVSALLSQAGIASVRRSALGAIQAELMPGTILLVDTVGELMDLYAISDLAFVGGSLVPVGGHNPLEPASLGVPTIFGPHTDNFREISEVVVSYDAGIRIASASELTRIFLDLLEHDIMRRKMGENGIRLLSENSGATLRHMDVIAGFMPRNTGNSSVEAGNGDSA
jgi:3-deoxy-D-manno-octulosonic-acid transferase